MTDIAVKGLRELDNYLSHLPRNLQKGAYRAGLVAAAAVIRDEARLRAPKRTGRMAKSIKTGSARQNQDGTFSVSVRLQGPHDFLGVFHEYGVAPHFISPGDSGVSARLTTRRANEDGLSSDVETGALKIGDNFISGGVMHPGHGAHPFMRPALDTKANEAVMAFRDRIVGYLEKKTGFNASAPLDLDQAA